MEDTRLNQETSAAEAVPAEETAAPQTAARFQAAVAEESEN